MARFFNANLKYLRQKIGISQQELADKIGTDRSTISRWENGEIDTPLDMAMKIAEVLNIPYIDFFGRDLRFDNGTPLETRPVETIKIPVLGVIKAGIPIEAQENIIDYVDIPKEWTLGGKQFYALKISGDSMFPKYQPDDIVVFEKSDDINAMNKKDCVVMVNGDDATFKNVIISENGLTLVPLNLNNSDGFQPTFYTIEQITGLPIKIIGIAKRKISDV